LIVQCRPVNFGFALMSTTHVAETAQEYERLGAGLISVGEGATEFRDPFLLLGELARATASARLTIGVTTPRLRHPAVLANAFASLHELSGGRAMIGLGSGDLGLMQLGERPVRLAELAEYATAVRALARGDAIPGGDGRPVRIRWASADIPLMLAADGPKMLALAGSIADAVLVGQAGHPDIVRTVRDRVARAADAAGRSPSDVAAWFMLRAIVTDHSRGAIGLEGFDEYGARQAHFLWRVCGAPSADDAADVIEQRKGLRLDADIARRLVAYCHEYSAERAWGTKHNVELLEHHGLTEWAGDLFYVSGDESTVARRIGELVAAGAANFLIPARDAPTVEERAAVVAPVAAILRRIQTIV
jgi:5,10-methylenetetrahydromethanopterin reductase